MGCGVPTHGHSHASTAMWHTRMTGPTGGPSHFAERELVRRDDTHAALAGRDEDQFGAAADEANLDGFLRQAIGDVATVASGQAQVAPRNRQPV
jgi:hypothetical protein